MSKARVPKVVGQAVCHAEHPEGAFVRFEDAKALEDRNAELESWLHFATDRLEAVGQGRISMGEALQACDEIRIALLAKS